MCGDHMASAQLGKCHAWKQTAIILAHILMKQEVPDFSSSNGRVNYHPFLLEEIWKVKSITWNDYQFNSRRRKTTRSCYMFTIGHWIYNRTFYKDDLEKVCVHQGKRKERRFWVSNVSFQVALQTGLWLYLQSSITSSDAWKTPILVDCIAAVTKLPQPLCGKQIVLRK